MNKLNNCELCGNVINRPLRPKSKFFISWGNYNTYRFCSKKCRFKYQSIRTKGENHYNYSGGKPKCIDCNKQLTNYGRNRCRTCYVKYNCGKNNPSWKDTIINYKYIHQFLYKTYGRPLKCEFCGATENLEYANKKGNYTKDISDYYSLCKKCHRNYDLKEPKRPSYLT